MTDPRMTKLANLLVNYSCKVKKGDNVPGGGYRHSP